MRLRRARGAESIKNASRFAGLDLLRGTAALMILALHDAPTRFVEKAYLGVDLFFVLSGFVLAHTYQQRLERDFPRGRFMLIRLIRLYPVYIIGTLLGAGLALIVRFDPGAPRTAGSWVATLGLSLLFLPTPLRWAYGSDAAFPFDFPAWSLFWEMAVNLLYALTARWLGLGRAVAIVLAGAIGVAITAWAIGTFEGAERTSLLWSGGTRALFAFFAGVAIYRLRLRKPVATLSGWLLPPILVAMVVVGTGRGALFDLACALLVCPLLVWLGAGATGGPLFRRVSDELGYLSYPLYALQAPLVTIAVIVAGKSEFAVHHPILWSLATMAFVIAVSWAVARLIDEPLRVRLRAGLVPRAPQPPAETAP